MLKVYTPMLIKIYLKKSQIYLIFLTISWLIWLINSDIYCNYELHCWVFFFCSIVFNVWLIFMYDKCKITFYELFRILYIVVCNLQRFIRLSSYIFLCVSSLKQSRVITPKILHTYTYTLKFFRQNAASNFNKLLLFVKTQR